MFKAHAEHAPNPLAGVLFFVTTLDDHDDGACNAGCTLREAINAANSNLANEDGIDFSVTGTINLSSELPENQRGVSVQGPGAQSLTVRRDAGGDYRVFTMQSGGTVSFSGLKISNGNLRGSGAGISNEGDGNVNVMNCTVSGNFSLRAFGAALLIQTPEHCASLIRR